MGRRGGGKGNLGTKDPPRRAVFCAFHRSDFRIGSQGKENRTRVDAHRPYFLEMCAHPPKPGPGDTKPRQCNTSRLMLTVNSPGGTVLVDYSFCYFECGCVLGTHACVCVHVYVYSRSSCICIWYMCEGTLLMSIQTISQ